MSKAPAPPTPPEAARVAELRTGSKAAFAQLYDDYAPALFGVLKKMVREEAMAEDLLQDAFVKIWRNIHTYDASKGRLFTWLLNICRNLAIDQLRSAAQQRSNVTGDLANARNIGQSDNQPLALPDLAIVRDRINKMRPEQRALLELIYFQGYTHIEAAETLEIPLGTAKTRIRSALTELRTLLGTNQP